MTAQHPQISISQLNKNFGAFRALDDISIDIPKGSFVALVGPSGCGKSTLLRTIAGLGKPTSGKIEIDGALVNDVPPRGRDVAMVFQSYALYPHMTVAGNITYSLRVKKRPKTEIEKKLAEAAAIVGLEDLLNRYPKELSGGQRQRVAMARAIVRDPAVFLFDEPLSNLDAALRVRMRGQIRELHERLGATSVYVTHDQIEAMTMADIIVVMRAGVVEQIGAPLELYDNPANTFVAGFIGSPAMNFLPARLTPECDQAVLSSGKAIELPRDLGGVTSLTIGIRPEHLQIDDGCSEDVDTVRFDAKISSVEATGSAVYAECQVGSDVFTVVMQGRSSLKVGDHVSLSAKKANFHIFDPETGQAF